MNRGLGAPALALSALVVVTGAVEAGTDRVIYEKVSRYNKIVVTEDEEGIRTLWFERDTARQSVVKPGDPDYLDLAYTRAMPLGLAVCDEPDRILVVGLGGGSIPMFVRKYYPRAVIHAVEIDAEVVVAARKCFGFREDARMKAFVADGRAFIEASPGAYDLIFLDAYGPDSIPYALVTKEFLLSVRKALTPRGAVASNVWSPVHNRLYDSMVRTYRDVFGGVAVVNAVGSGNRIILARPPRWNPAKKDFAREASALSRRKSLPYDLGEIVRKGWQDLPAYPGKGEVLRDGREPPPRGR